MLKLVFTDTLPPHAFEEYFKMMIGEIAPQNRRAFAAIIKLLAEYVLWPSEFNSY